MKRLTIILVALICTNSIKSQCKVQTTNRSDGYTVKYLRPELVGSGNKCELGLSIQTIGNLCTINAVVRYIKANPKKLKGDLKIKLVDDNSIEPKLISTEFATQNNEQLTLGVYSLSNTDIIKLKKSPIKIIVFQEEEGLNQIVLISVNADVAQRHIKCLTK